MVPLRNRRKQRQATVFPASIHHVALLQQGIVREFIPLLIRKNWTITTAAKTASTPEPGPDSKILPNRARLNASGTPGLCQC